jgi:hypothetical protein
MLAGLLALFTLGTLIGALAVFAVFAGAALAVSRELSRSQLLSPNPRATFSAGQVLPEAYTEPQDEASRPGGAHQVSPADELATSPEDVLAAALAAQEPSTSSPRPRSPCRPCAFLRALFQRSEPQRMGGVPAATVPSSTGERVRTAPNRSEHRQRVH